MEPYFKQMNTSKLKVKVVAMNTIKKIGAIKQIVTIA